MEWGDDWSMGWHPGGVYTREARRRLRRARHRGPADWAPLDFDITFGGAAYDRKLHRILSMHAAKSSCRDEYRARVAHLIVAAP